MGPGNAVPSGQYLRAFTEAGISPSIARSFLARDWTDASAIAWAKLGLAAGEAAIWHELGVRPAEARRLISAGVTAYAVVRDWWQAGVPFDDVAPSLGAGLAPAEALAQRGETPRGRLQVLRALRADSPDIG